MSTFKYEHPNIVIDRPTSGYYVIYGHNPQFAKSEDGQIVVPMRQCYITPEIPETHPPHRPNEHTEERA